jgi:sensor histidine kinase YesM
MNGKMKTPIDLKRIKLYLWIALGYCFLGIFAIMGDYPGKFIPLVFNNIWAVIYVTMLNYILFEYTIPFVLKKRKTFIYNFLLGIPGLFFHLMLYSYGAYAWRSLGIKLHVFTALKTYPTLDIALENQMAFSMGSFFIFGIIRHIYYYVKLKQASQQLQIEKQAAELHYLRSQTNPHFLFNTLNNIYSLARDKSDLAPESILRLSKILRFMLYETVGEYISIEQELKVMSDYISLEQLRYDETLRINFNHDIEDMKQAIPPLLLIPLVENAFKHGVSETRGYPFVDIHLSINQRQLSFIVKNSTGSTLETGLFPGQADVKENIGLSNLRRQLELLYKEFNLSVFHGTAEFTAKLKINLASHV